MERVQPQVILHLGDCVRDAQRLEERYPRLGRVKWIWLGVAAALFVLLYPGLSGLPIPAWWAKIIKCLPGGGLMYGA